MSFIDSMFNLRAQLDLSIYVMVFVLSMAIITTLRPFQYALFFSSLITLVLYLAPVFLCIGGVGICFIAIAVESLHGYEELENERHIRKLDKRHTVTEYNENGTIVAYRYFEVLHDGTLSSVALGQQIDGGRYDGNYKRSHRVPTMKNSAGVYAAKTPDSPILDEYRGHNRVLAQVELSSRVVEGKYGFRAQECRVVKIIR